jgi:hypothetical protein
VDSLRIKELGYGIYRYSPHSKRPLLHASVFAVLVRDLFSDLKNLTQQERNEWASYIMEHQRSDGLFVDPLVRCRLAERAHHWGWNHLTVYALMSLTALGVLPKRHLFFLERFTNIRFAEDYLKGCLRRADLSFAGNEIFNYGALLQYARDFLGETSFDETLSKWYNILDKYVDSKTGLWHRGIWNNLQLSEAIQTSYHIYLLYFYDGKMPRYPISLVKVILHNQNSLGGFGPSINSSACEDIDSIDPLCRLYGLLDISLKKKVSYSLRKALAFNFANMMEDGGFVFKMGSPFLFGHHLMKTRTNESSIFGTMKRICSIAFICTALKEEIGHDFNWNFLNCPGYQFWNF